MNAYTLGVKLAKTELIKRTGNAGILTTHPDGSKTFKQFPPRSPEQEAITAEIEEKAGA